MANPNLLNIDERKKIIEAIQSPENIARKMAEQRKFDIYRRRQAPYVLQRLTDEFDVSTVKDMRKVLSINPCKRIVDEQASLYVSEPEREFPDTDDKMKEQIDAVYNCAKVDPAMRLANRYYKLHGQTCLYSVPRKGKLTVRALTPKDYDVIPDEDNPEEAFGYVLNVLDVDLHRSAPQASTAEKSEQTYQMNDQQNQAIADTNDRKALTKRFVFWTNDLHFTCDGEGKIVDTPYEGETAEASALNPIKRLPFVDIAHEKDFAFFVQIGSDVAEFVIDFLTQLSDLANTCRLQNYSQAIVYSTEEPKPIKVGPSSVIWMKFDPNNPTAKPEFTFQSPKPDIVGSLEFLNVQLKMFLSSVGLNPGTVSGKNEIEKFASGIDHLLANLDKFKASKEDMDLFRSAEGELFDILVAWQNELFDVTDETGLGDDLKVVKIDAEIEMEIIYVEPHAVQTDSEVETYCITARKEGLMTRKEAVKRMYKVDDAQADAILKELDAEAAASAAKTAAAAPKLGLDGKPIAVAGGAPDATGAPGAAQDAGSKGGGASSGKYAADGIGNDTGMIEN